MNDWDKLNFYRKYVPTNFDELFKKCNTNLEHEQFDILKWERMVTLYQLQFVGFPHINDIKSNKDLVISILETKILNIDEIASDFIQNASLVISNIYNDIESFAVSVIKNSIYTQTKSKNTNNSKKNINFSEFPSFDFSSELLMRFNETTKPNLVTQSNEEKNFNYIVFYIIPAVFGFFSAAEFAELATIFYSHVIGKSKDPRQTYHIVLPFLRSVTTYRFIEYIMEKFAPQFGSEIYLKDMFISSSRLREKIESNTSSLPADFAKARRKRSTTTKPNKKTKPARRHRNTTSDCSFEISSDDAYSIQIESDPEDSNQGYSFENIHKLFFKYFEEALPLIPSYHILLLNLMQSSYGWTDEMTVSFFFDNFFFFESKRWIESSSYIMHKPFFIEIMRKIFDYDKTMIKTIVKKLLRTNSQFEIPYIYQPFNHKYLNLLVTPYDVSIITYLLKSVDKLKFEYYHELSSAITYRPFWVRIYPYFDKFNMNFKTILFENMKSNDTLNHHKLPKKKNGFTNSSQPTSNPPLKTDNNSNDKTTGSPNEINQLISDNEIEHQFNSNSETSIVFYNEKTAEDDAPTQTCHECQIIQKYEYEHMFGLIENRLRTTGETNNKGQLKTVIDFIEEQQRRQNETNSPLSSNHIHHNRLFDDDFFRYAVHKTLQRYEALSEKFELFLYQKTFADIVHTFHSISSNHFDSILGQVAMWNCNMSDFSYSGQFHFDFSMSLKMRQTDKLIQLQPVIIDLYKKYKSKFMELSNEWSYFSEKFKMIKSIDSPIDLDISQHPILFNSGVFNLTPQRHVLFWEAVELLRSLTAIPYFLRFSIIDSILEKIEIISSFEPYETKKVEQKKGGKTRMKFLLDAFVACENIRILTTFTLFSTCLMKNDAYRLFVSDKSLDLWTNFESSFMKYLSDYEEGSTVFQIFIDLQARLAEEMKLIGH